MIDDEDSTARLLRLAGPRPLAPAERAARVRQAVHEGWRLATRRRMVRRRVAMAAALLAVLGAASWIGLMRRDVVVSPASRLVAKVEQVDGPFEHAAGVWLREGAWVETAPHSRVAMRLTGGTSVRLDAGSRARLISASIVELVDGALYVDTGGESGGLEVRTAVGTARDIGTQFDVRLFGRSLRVRVRTGVVELRREGGDHSVTARAGTEITVTGQETVTRPIAAYGSDWAWAASLAPRFDIEGRSVAAFLEHVSREQGWSLRYEDAALARDAASIILHGSVAGLEPDDALAAALATSNLEHHVRNGELTVSRRAERDER